uniref:Uncharacterized protein n=1 Tax=Octopus bimaculoides TaxID=37653 RepID=A0A0L8IGD0_OCTBM
MLSYTNFSLISGIKGCFGCSETYYKDVLCAPLIPCYKCTIRECICPFCSFLLLPV